MWRDSESEHDFLNFTEVADQIAALVANPAPLLIPVGVFGGWGTGKPTVLGLVEARLPKGGEDGAPRPILVKFDAWLYQGFDDARAALMEVVSAALIERAEGDETLLQKAKGFARRVNYFRRLGLIADFGVGVAQSIVAEGRMWGWTRSSLPPARSPRGAPADRPVRGPGRGGRATGGRGAARTERERWSTARAPGRRASGPVGVAAAAHAAD